MILDTFALDFGVVYCIQLNMLVFKVEIELSVFVYVDLRAGPQ